MEQFSTDAKTLERMAVMLKAMADPNRLRIMNVLMDGESCNCEFVDSLGLPSNLLSHHLRVLKKAGLVDSRRDAVDGRWIYYSVNEDAVAQWNQWWGQFFDTSRIQHCKKLCGPEGQLMPVDPQHVVLK